MEAVRRARAVRGGGEARAEMAPNPSVDEERGELLAEKAFVSVACQTSFVSEVVSVDHTAETSSACS